MMKALDQFKPDAICIELPPEVLSSISLMSHSDTLCPVAFLLYNRKKPEHCYYLPMAEFSPEYQALKYASKNTIPIFPMDMPAGHMLLQSQFTPDKNIKLNPKQWSIVRDPLGYLAKLQGFEDSELWWNQFFESWTSETELFETIQNLMTELRKQSKGLDDEETLLREKFMRSQIRLCISKGFSKIAIVCGAWHGPVLTQEFILNTSKEKIRNLKTVDCNCTIIPWSYERLMLNRKYSAGIVSPAWNESLFTDPSSPVSHWLCKAAESFRNLGYQVSTSEVIDAETLARQLALLRGLPLVGVSELREALITIFGQGDPARIDLLHQQIFIGSKVGTVKHDSKTLPVISEFHACLQQYKLRNYWGVETHQKVELDLRKENAMARSRFLHKTKLMDLPWATEMQLEIKAQGNFHEHWSFNWSPELEVRLIQIGILGPTLNDAILRIISEKIRSRSSTLELLGQLFEHALKSGMVDLFAELTETIRDICIETDEVEHLASLIRPLLAGISYGNLHQIDTQKATTLIEMIMPRLIFHFAEQCVHISEDKAKKMLEVLHTIHSFFFHIKNNQLYDDWKIQLNHLLQDNRCHPVIRGRACHMSLEEKWIDDESLYSLLISECSASVAAAQTASWIEGFLLGGTAFYLIQENLLKILDGWLMNLDDSEFKSILPLLRRSFSKIAYSETIRIQSKLKLTEHGSSKAALINWKLQNNLLEIIKSNPSLFQS